MRLCLAVITDALHTADLGHSRPQLLNDARRCLASCRKPAECGEDFTAGQS